MTNSKKLKISTDLKSCSDKLLGGKRTHPGKGEGKIALTDKECRGRTRWYLAQIICDT
jgi:hypothetical protein